MDAASISALQERGGDLSNPVLSPFCIFPLGIEVRAPTEADASIQNPTGSLSAIPTPTLHRTETKKAETDQAEGGGFGDTCTRHP